MKVTLFMAISVNGIIARENGDEDFLSDDDWKTFEKLSKKAKCVITGRKTYESVMKWMDYNFDSLKEVTKIIVSKNSNLKLSNNSFLASSPKNALALAKSQGFKEVILAGGSHLNSSFIKENLIDEIILNVDPVIIGKGIPLFSEDNFEKKLKFYSSRKLQQGIIQLYYKL